MWMQPYHFAWNSAHEWANLEGTQRNGETVPSLVDSSPTIRRSELLQYRHAVQNEDNLPDLFTLSYVKVDAS